MLSVDTIKKLSLIKYLCMTAEDQSRRPEPFSAASILTFYNSVMLFMELAAEHLEAGVKGPNFIDYWELLAPKMPNGELTQKESMLRLHTFSNALTSQGKMPLKHDIEGSRTSTLTFFKENTPEVFGIHFETISPVNMIICVEARNNLEEADSLLQNGGNLEDALDKIAIAFTQMLDDYENRKRAIFGRSPFLIGGPLTFESSFILGIKDSKMASFIDEIRDTIESMQKSMKALSLGLDYKRYIKFQLLIPDVWEVADGKYIVSRCKQAKPLTV